MAVSDRCSRYSLPVCKVKVELKADGSGLKCIQCKRVYPIRDDIPVMRSTRRRLKSDSRFTGFARQPPGDRLAAGSPSCSSVALDAATPS